MLCKCSRICWLHKRFLGSWVDQWESLVFLAILPTLLWLLLSPLAGAVESKRRTSRWQRLWRLRSQRHSLGRGLLAPLGLLQGGWGLSWHSLCGIRATQGIKYTCVLSYILGFTIKSPWVRIAEAKMWTELPVLLKSVDAVPLERHRVFRCGIYGASGQPFKLSCGKPNPRIMCVRVSVGSFVPLNADPGGSFSSLRKKCWPGL